MFAFRNNNEKTFFENVDGDEDFGILLKKANEDSELLVIVKLSWNYLLVAYIIFSFGSILFCISYSIFKDGFIKSPYLFTPLRLV